MRHLKYTEQFKTDAAAQQRWQLLSEHCFRNKFGKNATGNNPRKIR